MISIFIVIINMRYPCLWDHSFLLLFGLLRSRLFLHPHDFLLPFQLFRGHELAPLLIELRLLGLDIQVDSLAPQLLGLLVQQQHPGDVLLAPHPLPLDELHVSLVIVLLLVSKQRVLDGSDVFDVHVGIVADVQTE